MPLARSIHQAILDHFTGKAAWTAPAAIYIGLSTTAPTTVGGNVTEPSGGGYARVQVTAANFTAASAADPAVVQNSAEVSFAVATATWAAGANMTHAVLFTAETAGTFLGSGALAVAKPVTEGDTARYPAGQIQITVGPAA